MFILYDLVSFELHPLPANIQPNFTRTDSLDPVILFPQVSSERTLSPSTLKLVHKFVPVSLGIRPPRP